MLSKRTLGTLLAGLLIVLLAGMIPAAHPVDATRTVTVGATGCDFATIQAALDDAGVTAGDVIQIRDAVHTEGGIAVGKDVVIQGPAVVQAHADFGAAQERVFLIQPGATVILRDLTIRHGNPHLDEYFRCGGGIVNKGTLTLENCVITDNTANSGGGIWNNRGAVTAINCTISQNVADRDAPPGYECGSGGGIKLEGGGTLDLVNCTISDNEAKGKAGGLFVACETTATLTNCTISGNQAADRGGGLFTKNVLYLTNCTVVHNRTEAAAGGGGIRIRATLHMTDTIVAYNSTTLAHDCDIGGPGGYQGKGQVGANTRNWVQDGSIPSVYTGDPLLGPLADNGGPVQTHALFPGSQAIDRVPAAECTVTTDQRSLPRPVVCTSPDTPGDLGAFEVQAGECVPPIPSGASVTPTAPPSPTPAPPTPEPTSIPPTPTPVPVPSNDLLPVCGLLGVVFPALAGLVILWLRRRW
ncbi:MAG: right-handed parallel beta-helix repeat-containing protein [Chloroflexi bacterium]|nr:right-handed parallel beta-helix repeat-containing protein [Chloroflexota bacterium]MBU1749477.1 right-handed parallel beta-helix repeat-containing protein [Chloroflexota bacterium]